MGGAQERIVDSIHKSKQIQRLSAPANPAFVPIICADVEHSASVKRPLALGGDR
jgi:hypothetical protein